MQSSRYVPITYEKRNVLEHVLETIGRHPDRCAVDT